MEKKELQETGASLFGRSIDLMGDDPLEEIFALNLGDFVSECLISEDLAKKVSENSGNKIESLKKQLKELVSIYSLEHTLCVLGFNSKEDYMIYNSIAATIKQMLDSDDCHVYLTREFAKGLDKCDKDLSLVGTSKQFEEDFYKYNIGYKFDDKSLVMDAFENKRVVSVDNPNKLSNFTPVKELDEDKTVNYTVVPMHNNVYTVGTIVIENYEDKKLKDEYMKLVVSMAKLFATSMSLQRVTDEVKGVLEEEISNTSELQHMRAELTALIGDLGDEQQVFVKAMATAVDVKGQYLVAHSQNTADLSRLICKQLKLNEKTSDLIYYAGLLQNIGKITLPSDLFTKGGKLSKEDWEKLQNHPNVGVNLLMNINFLSEVIPYIHYHKERWDGQGEPEGLKGFSIPFGSRIIAVADAYSALTSDRPFRKAMDKETALAIIKNETEVKWDPIVVEALEQVV